MTVLVTGASGALGRLVMEEMIDVGVDVIATTRTPDALSDLSHRGAQVRFADFDDPAILRSSFDGADRALIISTDAIDGTNRRVRQHQAAIDAAVAAGVEHILYTSCTNPRPSNPAAIAPDHHATEQALVRSGTRWTSLRNNSYSEMTLLSLAPAVASGLLVSAAGDGAVSYVSREDCARVAARALTAPELPEGPIDVTGRSALTHADLAQVAAEVTGRPVEYVAVDVEEAVRLMIESDMPEALAEVLVTFDLAAAAGELAVVSTAVHDFTGSDPEPLASFLQRYKDTFAPVPI